MDIPTSTTTLPADAAGPTGLESLLITELNLVMAEFEVFIAEFAASTRLYADADALSSYLAEENLPLELARTIQELVRQARVSRARRFPNVSTSHSVKRLEAAAEWLRTLVDDQQEELDGDAPVALSD